MTSVDHAEIAQVDHLRFDDPACGRIRSHVEADDNCVRSHREIRIRLADTPGCRRDDVDLHLLGRELRQRIAERLDRTLHVGLDNDVEGTGLALLHLLQDVLKLCRLPPGKPDLAMLAVSEGRDLARLPLVGDDDRLIAGIRRPGQSQHLHWSRRTGRGRLGTGLVQQPSHPTELLARQENVPPSRAGPTERAR